MHMHMHMHAHMHDMHACVCAGALLVEEAGGRVSDLEGMPLDFSRGAQPRPLSDRTHLLEAVTMFTQAVGVAMYTPSLQPYAPQARSWAIMCAASSRPTAGRSTTTSCRRCATPRTIASKVGGSKARERGGGRTGGRLTGQMERTSTKPGLYVRAARSDADALTAAMQRP
jgi:hypothetical protein